MYGKTKELTGAKTKQASPPAWAVSYLLKEDDFVSYELNVMHAYFNTKKWMNFSIKRKALLA